VIKCGPGGEALAEKVPAGEPIVKSCCRILSC
jgi:hypothetical protein